MSPSAVTTAAARAEAVMAMATVRPSRRQLAWQAMEFYGFVHFGINTMTGREWGLGHEDPALFDPTDLDVDQWMSTLAAARMTGVILTAKHHDGFCLWPSAVTTHSVAASPWREGHGDLVAEVAASARRHGLRFGIYLSPWDRTEQSYGSGGAYDDFYVAQLTELLGNYGELFSVWFDGANGEGPDGRRQTYDWDRYYDVVRRLQPDAVINVCGPDVRWCGNEAGHTRADEWSVVPGELRDVERIAEKSQRADDPAFARSVRSDDEDLGSRTAVVGKEHDLVWYPAEVNTSIRPGWFHHEAENSAVRPAEELFALHQAAVGGNSCFLLNVPPDRAGRFSAEDVAALTGLGRLLDDFSGRVLDTTVTTSSGRIEAPPGAPADGSLGLGNGTGHWRPDVRDREPRLSLHLPGPTWVDAVVVKEEIELGQRIEQVVVLGRRGAETLTLAEFGAVGYQRIASFPATQVDEIVIVVHGARGVPLVAGAAAVAAPDDQHNDDAALR